MKRPWLLLLLFLIAPTLFPGDRRATADDAWLSFSCIDAVGGGDSYLLATAGAGGGSVTVTGGNRMQDIQNFPAGNISAVNGQTAINELDAEKQPLATSLTTLAGKTILGTGANVRLSTGSVADNDCAKFDSFGNLVSAGAACGSGGGGSSVASGITNTPAGNISSTNVQAALNELDTEKQPLDADLTTLAGKTIAGTGADVRMSTGSYAANDCVKVDGSGNFTTAGAACGTGTGGGGGTITQNGLVSNNFTFANGTAGTDIDWTEAGSTLTLNVPDASPTARGVLTNDVQTIGGAKTFDTATTVPQLNVTGAGAGVIGLTGNDALHAWGLVGANRTTDLYLSLATDPTAANSALVCDTPSSTTSVCRPLTPQQAINTFSGVAAATNEYVLTKDTATGNALWKVATGSGGTVTGPGSSTADALAVWNGTGGATLKDSAVTVLTDGTLIPTALRVPHVNLNDTTVGIALDSTARIEWNGDTTLLRGVSARELQLGITTGSTLGPYTIHGQTVSGANTTGGGLHIGGGPGRGTGAGGFLTFETSPAGSTGSAINAPVTHMQIGPTGTINLPDMTASLGLCTDASKNIVSCAQGGTDASLLSTGTVPLARLANTQTVGDADATIVAPATDVLLTAAITAARTLTMPLANAYPAGSALRFVDTVGTITATNTIIFARAGSDTINGATSLTVTTSRATVTLVSDGTSKWSYGIQGIGRGGTGQTTAAAAIDALTAVNGVADGARLVSSSNHAVWARPSVDILLPVVGCLDTTAQLLWDSSAASAPTVACSAGATNTSLLRGVADFIDGSLHGIKLTIPLLSFTASSGFNLTLLYRTTVADNTKNTTWSSQISCSAVGGVDDIAYDTAATVTDANLATANQLNVATIAFSGGSMTSCTAGPVLLHIAITRDGTVGTDTLGATASLGAVIFSYSK
jgi:hypothetical protein